MEKFIKEAMKRINMEKVTEHLSGMINGEDRKMEHMLRELYPENNSHHGIKHIIQVIENARDIKGSSLDLVEVLAVCFHDCGCIVNRDQHENISAEIFKIVNVNGIIPNEYAVEIEDAIRCHRSSYKGELTTATANLLSAADRGNPGDVQAIYNRSYMYQIDHGSSHIEAIADAVSHVQKKYGRNSKNKFPQIYKEFYNDKLEQFYNDIDALGGENE